MRKILSFFVVWTMVVSMYALEVNNLRTQAYTNPIGIDISVPSFSWQLSSIERGVMQTSYSIKISIERDFSDIVWESGTIESSQSVDVQTTGFTPQARTRYYWQVSVTDNKGNAATSEELAYFEIGLKTTTAWNKSKSLSTIFKAIKSQTLTCHLLPLNYHLSPLNSLKVSTFREVKKGLCDS